MDRDVQFEELLASAQALGREGRFEESSIAAEGAVARSRALGSMGLEARATRYVSFALAHRGRVSEAMARLEAVMRHFERRESSPELHDALVAAAIFHMHLDWVSFAGCERAVPPAVSFGVLDRAESLLGVVGVGPRYALMSVRASLLAQQGKLAEAAQLHEAAILVFEPTAGYTLSTCRQQYADCLMQLARYESAEVQYTAIACDLGATARDKKSAYVGLAQCALARGDLAKALACAEEAVNVAARLGDDASCAALRVLVKALEANGESAHAIAAAERHVEIARRTSSKTRLYHALIGHADLAARLGDVDAARVSLDDALRVAEEIDARTGEDRYRKSIDARITRLGR
jgi:tetratricopeptide (TPR) repeat protein